MVIGAHPRFIPKIYQHAIFLGQLLDFRILNLNPFLYGLGILLKSPHQRLLTGKSQAFQQPSDGYPAKIDAIFSPDKFPHHVSGSQRILKLKL